MLHVWKEFFWAEVAFTFDWVQHRRSRSQSVFFFAFSSFNSFPSSNQELSVQHEGMPPYAWGAVNAH